MTQNVSQYIDKLRLTPMEKWDKLHVLHVMALGNQAVDELQARVTYLEDSLTAATCGELPERFDLNQLLLAKRAKSYMKWLAETVDPRDKLVPRPAPPAAPPGEAA